MPQSFIATTSEFIAHWESVNADLGAGNEITVAQGRGLVDLQAWRVELVALRDAVEAAMNGVTLASGAIGERKRVLRTRFGQLGRQLRARFDDSVWLAAFPKAPNLNANESRFTTPMREAANIWRSLEDDGETVELPGSYSRADFEADIAGLGADYLAWHTAQGEAQSLRADRNALQRRIYRLLKEYRQVIPGSLAPGSVFIGTLPALTPPKRRKPTASAGPVGG